MKKIFLNKPVEQHESDMSDMYNLQDELETILFAVGDSPTKSSEDQLMNMLIGVIELHRTRYEKMWMSWNAMQQKDE